MPTVFMDGTFKVVPSLFRQLYTLHEDFQGHIMPLAYFLLPLKGQETYTRMFNLIRDSAAARGLVFSPSKFHIDFEKAVIAAIHDIFPTAEVKVCTFHFTQAVWKNTQRFGLSTFYKDDPSVRK